MYNTHTSMYVGVYLSDNVLQSQSLQHLQTTYTCRVFLSPSHPLSLSLNTRSGPTLVGSGEVLVEHPLHDLGNVSRQRLASAQVHIVLIHLLKRDSRTLQNNTASRPSTDSLRCSYWRAHRLTCSMLRALRISPSERVMRLSTPSGWTLTLNTSNNTTAYICMSRHTINRHSKVLYI